MSFYLLFWTNVQINKTYNMQQLNFSIQNHLNMLLEYSSSLGSTFLTHQGLVSNLGRNSCYYSGKKKAQGRKEGEQKCTLLRHITKRPPMPLIPRPLQSNITGYCYLSLSFSPLSFSNAANTTHWVGETDQCPCRA